MKVKIEVFGFLRNHIPPRFKNHSSEFSVEDPTPLYYLLNEMLLLGNFDKIVLVNGKYVAPGYSLKEGDIVQIFSPVAGG
jgi:molybdopterin converting factor small subunit